MLWLALHLPHLSLESWAATLAPQDAERPQALLHAHEVQLVNARARTLGLRPGMKRATALALAPDLLWAAVDDQRDARALRAVAHVALAFSPSVTWATPALWRPGAAQADDDGTPPQPAPSPALVGVRLEVRSCLRYFGGLARLLQRLQDELAPLGHAVRIASAPTALGAALLAAWRADLALGPHSSDLAALQPLLDAVPLPLLGPGREHWQALQGMGLHTLADLAGLPRSGLARRFSPGLLADIDRARGRLPEAHTWLRLPQHFSSRLELQARADTSAQVLHGAQLLLARLVAWARARHGRIVRFTLLMHHEPRHRHDSQAPGHTALLIAPAQPSTDAAHLHTLLAERLGRLPLPAPALELSLQCDALVAGAAPNAELFASRRSEREGLARLVERLQARLGPEQVLRLSPVADHRPECATRWQPADAASLASASAASGPHPTSATHNATRNATHSAGAAHAAVQAGAAALARQPLWLLPAPQPLPLRQHQLLHDGQPLQLLAGPERLESGWWDSQLVLRDYFIAQAASGALLWVFHQRATDADAATPDGGSGWYLQGLFA